MFDDVGNIISYEKFITYQSFWTPPKEFNKVVKAKSPSLVHPDISHCRFTPNSSVDIHSALLLEGVSLLHKRKISSRGKLYWRSLVEDIDWNWTWLLPGKYCSSNKVKESHLKILYEIYLVNSSISKLLDIDSSCSLCKQAEDTLVHVFFDCPISKRFCSLQVLIYLIPPALWIALFYIVLL